MVVGDLEDDRQAAGLSEAFVQAGGRALHLVAVGEVFGELLPRRVQVSEKDDGISPARLRLEQLPEGGEAPHDVLRQLQPVAAQDDAPTVDGREQPGTRGLDTGRCRLPGEPRHVDPERGDDGPRLVGEVLAGAAPEAAGPALGVEPGGTARRDRPDELGRDVARKRPQFLRVAERRVGEMDRREIRAQLGESAADE